MIAEFFQLLGDKVLEAFPFTVVDVYEHAVRLDGGKFKKELSPGFHLKWPFYSQVLTTSGVWTTERTPPQSVTIKSGKCLVVSLAITWRVSDGRKFLLEVYDGKGACLDCIAGTVGEVLEDYDGEASYKTLAREIKRLANQRAQQWGIRFKRVQFADMAVARTLRLIQDHPALTADK